MIWVTRLDGERVLLNDDQVLFVEATHDTLLVLSSGDRLRILESPEELVDRVAQWRQRIMGLSLLHELEPDPIGPGE
ncbi:MAG: flagellar FlbD family protein [Myxococcota bacterium]|nr:flagellar protein FlbD [Deltaproteobacteria bacterium]